MRFTTEQQIENCKTFLRYWATVPEENVSPLLESWRWKGGTSAPHTCDTIACAGGWLSAMPEFVAMGVTFDTIGAPTIKLYRHGDFWLQPHEVAHYLFGNSNLFHSSQLTVATCFISAHEEVTRRFTDHLSFLERNSK